jgi:two-component system, NtrC family, sensor histidine kinase PilS
LAPLTEAPRDASDELIRGSAFARLWLGFMTARTAVALVLTVLLGALHTLAPALNVSLWLVGLCAAYLLAALAARVFTQPKSPGRAFDPQGLPIIAVDLLAIAALQFLQVAGINYSPLFALPILMAAVLGSSLLALSTAAGVALLLLIETWLQHLHMPPNSAELAARFLQAGLTGVGYFVLVLLVNQLAARLAREEQAALRGRRAARTQAQVNELVIEALSEGVLVVDSQCRVHTANPAARMLLGLPEVVGQASFPLSAQPGWEPLRELALRTFELRYAQLREVALQEEGAGQRRMHVRTRLTEESYGEGLCVMFLHDLREMEARLRTEKLAAMGRMSAAVAHEIRNPLAAITQANALLEEDLREPGLRQLSALVRKNAHRLAQIVEEILDVSRARGAADESIELELDAAVAAACADWAAQMGSSECLQLALGARGARVRFEPDHLRRILINLLDNALRYAAVQPDSIRVATRTAADGQASLHVWSDGEPLEPSVQRRLFEPFFSSESRSSGLGLYICRELCEQHGAAITYERRIGGAPDAQREGNEFVVSFGPPGGWVAGCSTSFDTIVA